MQAEKKTIGTSVLRKRPKHEEILRELRDSILNGVLRPGDCLRPFSEMCREFGVTQYVLMKALDELAHEGLVIRQPRRGTLVAERTGAASPPAAAPAAAAPAAAASTDMAKRHRVLSSMLHFNPPVTQAELRFFVTDGYPEQLRLWREVLDLFEKEHPRCRVTLDHVDEDFGASWHRAREADIVLCTPPVLRQLGAGHLMPIDDLSVFGLRPDRLHPKVAAYTDWSEPLSGVPCALLPPLLYVNTQAASRFSVETWPQANVRAFLDILADAMRRVPPEARQPFNVGTLFGLLTQDGAVYLTPDRRVRLDVARARHIIEGVRELNRLVPRGKTDLMEPFCEGKAVGLASGFYVSLYLKTHAHIAWQAHPLPVTPGAAGPEMPMLCAGIRQETEWLPECMSLVHHVCREQSQRRLAALGHCVPVIEAVAFEPEIVSRYPIPEYTLRQVLTEGNLCWAETPADQDLIHQIARIGLDAEQADWPAAKTLARVEMVYRHYRRSVERQEGDGATAEPAVSNGVEPAVPGR